jgi:hypothetical protein
VMPALEFPYPPLLALTAGMSVDLPTEIRVGLLHIACIQYIQYIACIYIFSI